VTYTRCHINTADSPNDSTDVLETCRELE
jgi:hypothetical protein